MMKRMLESLVTVVVLVSAIALAGCSGSDGAAGAAGAAGAPGLPGASGEVTNATCLSANCHGKATLVKTIVRSDAGKVGVEETVPLYVDNAMFTATVHGSQRCVACHTDINASGGAHGPVDKTYGGWARFSAKQAVEMIAINETPRTRNYITAASRSCVTCHSNHAGFENSAHATIYKQRDAAVNTALKTAAQAAFPTDVVGTLGEAYMVGDCNRCHAACSTCHFKSTIKRTLAGDFRKYWDINQAAWSSPGTVPVDGVVWNDTMTEFSMDWTTNVVSHEFRKGSYFKADKDPEGVCEACHTGLYKPAKNAYYWADAAKTIVKKVKATEGKRHMQGYELLISGMGNTQIITGGSNTVHAGFTCADCHKGLHSLLGLPNTWDVTGDAKCTDCHSGYTHKNATVSFHSVKVACVGCHAFGMARDFMYKSGAAVDNSTDVFLDPKSNQVRPVIRKQGVAEPWYPHNWQTFNAGTGKTDPAGDCARKCHYAGNQVGAGL